MTSQPEFTSVDLVVCRVVRCGSNLPAPVYIAGLELESSEDIQIGVPKLRGLRQPPYPTGSQSLLVTVHAEDLQCLHIAQGWRTPERIVDLAVEFRNIINGKSVPGGPSLAGAAIWFGLPVADAISAGNSPGQVRRRLHFLARLFERMRSVLD